MIFVGGKLDFSFKSRKEATRRVFECGLNGDFNIVLYADCTGVVGDESDEVCFLVPVHYPSFVHTFDSKVSLEKSVDRFFEFEEEETRTVLHRYVAGLGERRGERITDLR